MQGDTLRRCLLLGLVTVAATGSGHAQAPAAGAAKTHWLLALPPTGADLPDGSTWGLGVKVLSAETQDWQIDLEGHPKTQKVLAVVAEVSDPAGSDLLRVDEAASGLVDLGGNRVARVIFAHNDSDDPLAALPAGHEGARTHTLSLKLDVPPASAVGPLWLALHVRRYRNQALTFEWRGVGPSPQFPLEAERDGVSIRVDALEVANDPLPRTQEAVNHVVLRATATYLKTTPDAVALHPWLGRLVMGQQHRYTATSVYATGKSDPVHGGPVQSVTCEITYHFPDLTTVPEFKDIVLESCLPVVLSQPLAVPLAQQ